MRRFAIFCSAVALAACAKSETKVAGDTATAAGTLAFPTKLSLADVAGTWSVRAMPEGRDTTLVTYQIVATGDTSGWMITFPNRNPLPLRVLNVGGDSVVTEVGPYESVLRNGVTVTSRSVMRLRNGKLIGTFVAGYSTTGPDSVLHGRHEGTRVR